ncbi:hypothetical protein GCM10010124_32280 [Pilimelia terevasa]|uniref:Uncharacterized protein n=1 Tax=Pilimelia terevasa TaxID=53372 RepID=A0A8J3FJ50_9ACTN|nr:hypothetical protein [Pilimelia terevasa]GGK37148.1 hypothetical protein GCM10010124_32280 [Pilimelia terevasa]
MVDAQVTLDPTSMDPVQRKLRGPLQDQLTSALRNAVDRVGERYHGESVDEVADELLAETREGLHPDIAAGFVPDEDQLDDVAAALVDESRR